MGNTLVYVYGSLKNGYYNHGLLLDSTFMGTHITDNKYTLLNLGSYPAVITRGTTAIHGEIYRISESTLSTLDKLEDYPAFYDRILIATPFGNAWMYTLQKNKHHPFISSGIWLEKVDNT